jgi:hypothetical protein
VAVAVRVTFQLAVRVTLAVHVTFKLAVRVTLAVPVSPHRAPLGHRRYSDSELSWRVSAKAAATAPMCAVKCGGRFILTFSSLAAGIRQSASEFNLKLLIDKEEGPEPAALGWGASCLTSPRAGPSHHDLPGSCVLSPDLAR